jgi:hypothetical protein
MKTPIAVACLLAATLAHGQDHANCPHNPANRRAAVDQRHDEVTGVPHEGAVHHFLLQPSGGTIRLEVTQATDVAGRDRVRSHLQVVARAFADGDFSLPMHIHDEVPPGVDVMKDRKAAIRYVYAPTERGGEVRIATEDPEARAAIHRFLRFQIDDHGTGDPRE